jgi:hypothetical protein
MASSKLQPNNTPSPLADEGLGTPLPPPSFMLRHSCWAALLISSLLVFAHIGLDTLLLRSGGSRRTIALESSIIIGIVTFVLLLEIFRYSRQRRQQIVQRLETIDEMNHYIRNALQVISFNARPVSRNDAEFAEIQQAVRRINWALREVLPKMEPKVELFEGSAREQQSQLSSREDSSPQQNL